MTDAGKAQAGRVTLYYAVTDYGNPSLQSRGIEAVEMLDVVVRDGFKDVRWPFVGGLEGVLLWKGEPSSQAGMFDSAVVEVILDLSDEEMGRYEVEFGPARPASSPSPSSETLGLEYATRDAGTWAKAECYLLPAQFVNDHTGNAGRRVPCGAAARRDGVRGVLDDRRSGREGFYAEGQGLVRHQGGVR